MYLLGYDIGSSAIKAALVEAETGRCLAVAQSPEAALPIAAPRPGWAEQDPELWWQHVQRATQILRSRFPRELAATAAIGISYQMHGLVIVDERGQALRPAIIWCDSRAVPFGEAAWQALGPDRCLRHLLNSPGNFTAAKLAWVKTHEPDIFRKIHKIMWPGDYVAMRLGAPITTTACGLSEGIFWDFLENGPAAMVLDHFGFDPALLPALVENPGLQGRLSAEAASALGLPAGIPIGYRAGDQPNNALSLGVLHPGQAAATGGTSGVVYGISDQLLADPLLRVNSFLHVNHQPGRPRIGVLLCINGAGILYGWLRQHLAHDELSFREMDELAASIEPGSGGLTLLPFGNGAERMLGNRFPGACIAGLQLTLHTDAHLYRAALEGIAFAFHYGMQAMTELGLPLDTIRTGNDNLFRSAIFSQTLSNLAGCTLQVLDATGAAGAARAAGVTAGCYVSLDEAVSQLDVVAEYAPERQVEALLEARHRWQRLLEATLALL